MVDAEKLIPFLRMNVVPICLFKKKPEGQVSVIADEFKIIGTGFNIATFGNEAILISASHLSEAFEEKFDPDRYQDLKFFPDRRHDPVVFDTDEACVFFDYGGPSWRKADIVIGRNYKELDLEKGENYSAPDISYHHVKFRHKKHQHLKQLAIDSGKLKKGQKVYVFGYSGLEYTTGGLFPPVSAVDPEDFIFHHFEGDINTIHEGVILDIHEGYKGVYEIDIPVKSGMSGGLVFYLDSKKNPVACGVISFSPGESSQSTDTQEGQGCFVTPIGDILNFPMLENNEGFKYIIKDANGNPKKEHTIYTLSDLIEFGVIVDIAKNS